MSQQLMELMLLGGGGFPHNRNLDLAKARTPQERAFLSQLHSVGRRPDAYAGDPDDMFDVSRARSALKREFKSAQPKPGVKPRQSPQDFAGGLVQSAGGSGPPDIKDFSDREIQALMREYTRNKQARARDAANGMAEMGMGNNGSYDPLMMGLPSVYQNQFSPYASASTYSPYASASTYSPYASGMNPMGVGVPMGGANTMTPSESLLAQTDPRFNTHVYGS